MLELSESYLFEGIEQAGSCDPQYFSLCQELGIVILVRDMVIH